MHPVPAHLLPNPLQLESDRHQRIRHERIQPIRKTSPFPRVQIRLLEHFGIHYLESAIPPSSFVRLLIGLLARLARRFGELFGVVPFERGAVRKEGGEGGKEGDKSFSVGVDEEFTIG
jgi:hypothetical protein